MRFSGCLRVLNNTQYRTKRGEAGWLAVGREAEKAHAGSLKAEGGGHLPLLLRGASRAPRSGGSSSSRSEATVPRRPPFTRNFTRSGDFGRFWGILGRFELWRYALQCGGEQPACFGVRLAPGTKCYLGRG